MKKIIFAVIISLFLIVGCKTDESNNMNNLDISGVSQAFDSKYTNMVEIDNTQLNVVYNLDLSLMEEHSIKSSSANNGDFYALIKVKSENKEKVKEQMAGMLKIMEEQNNLYSPDAVKKINNRLETSIGNYLIYIISDDNVAYYETLKGYIK